MTRNATLPLSRPGLRWKPALAAACLMAMTSLVAPLATPAFAQAERTVILGSATSSAPIEINPGFTLTLRTSVEFADIVVGNMSVADVFPLTGSSVYVQGNAPGTTNIAFYDANKKLLGTAIIRVKVDFAELESTIRRAFPTAQVNVDNVNGKIRLSGTVEDAVQLKSISDLAQQYSPDPVVNAIRVTDPQQVQLDVRIVEVSRNSGRELGVDLRFQTNGSTVGTTGGTSTSIPFGNFVGSLLSIGGTDVDYIINVLENKGLARRLANPTLVTTSGVEANFVVGGEIPITTAFSAENGTVATETGYREYGVRLNFKPVVLEDSKISLRIRPEVSDIDSSVSVNGQPAFISRKADTTVTLRDGQSFAIAGLLQVDNERNIQQVPWLGQIPILGTLFRSTAFQKRETDLVILVTPALVRPGRPAETLRTPLDDSRSSSDVELFLLGMLEVNKDMIRSFIDGSGVVGPYGHMIDLEFDDALITKK